MKKRISFILATVMILVAMLPAFPAVAASNTFNANDANPTISTAADYVAFFNAAFVDKTSDFKGKTITMLNDITLNDTTAADWYAKAGALKLVGTNDTWIWFQGNFDGGNHTLKGAIVEGTFRNDYVTGLFPFVGDGGSVKNLVVDGFYVCSNNTTADVSSDRVGAGGLIGIAKKNVTIDNVTMKNGIVTCVENGKGALGALLGTYTADKWTPGIANQYLKVTNTTVYDSVRVVAPASSNVYVGGFMGHVSTNLTDGIYIDLTGSAISPAGSVEGTLNPFGNFYFNSNGGYIWYFVANGSTSSVRIDSANTYNDKFNSAILNTGCYGVALESDNGDNTFNADDANPTISTAADYVAFFNAAFKDGTSFKGKTVTLLEDITVNDTTAAEWYKASGVTKFTGSSIWTWFEGNFDGNGHTIKGVIVDGYYRSNNDKVTGLFPHARTATIQNVTFDGFYVNSNGAQATGGLIGRVGNSVTLQGVTMKNGTVNATNSDNSGNQRGVGALVGYAYFDTDADQFIVANDCTVEASVRVNCDNTNWAGGIIGGMQLQNKNHATINLKGSDFKTMDENLAAVGYYNQNAKDGYQVKMTVDGSTNKWAGSGSGEKTAWVNETIAAFGIYNVLMIDFAGFQTRTSDNAVRFVGLIKAPADLSEITKLGFEVTVNGQTVGADVIKCTKVYTSILVDGETVAAPDGYYYFTFAITEVAAGTTFAVKACATVNGADYATASSTYTYTPAA